MLDFVKDYPSVMMRVERMLGAIVEAFDQKDGQDLGEHFRRSNSTHSRQLRKQKVTNEQREPTGKKNLKTCNRENKLKARLASALELYRRIRQSARGSR